MLTYLEGLRFAKTMVTESQVVLAIFIVSFALILLEVVHRTIAAWFGSVLMLLYGHYTGVFHLHEQYNAAGELVKTYTLEHTMLGWIEWEVIGLLLGMMIFASILEICGFFEYVAIKAAKMSKIVWPQAAHLAVWLLQEDPERRPKSWDQVMDHPFFSSASRNRARAD